LTHSPLYYVSLPIIHFDFTLYLMRINLLCIAKLQMSPFLLSRPRFYTVAFPTIYNKFPHSILSHYQLLNFTFTIVYSYVHHYLLQVYLKDYLLKINMYCNIAQDVIENYLSYLIILTLIIYIKNINVIQLTTIIYLTTRIR